MMNAIPTIYRGVYFRSRLEAKWAAMFDLAGWRWCYEPIDLNGYIPDFSLQGVPDPILVDVKPYFNETALRLRAEELGPILRGRTEEILFLGADLIVAVEGNLCLGLVTERAGGGMGVDGLEPAAPIVCVDCGSIGFCNAIHSYHSRICGHNGQQQLWDVDSAWKSATNTVRWRPRGRS